MKAVVYHKYGPPDVLQVAEIEKPTPKDNEILVKVVAAEVTKTDCELRSFNFPVKWFALPLRLAVGIMRPRRKVLGGYLAGEVEATGKDITKFKAGDQIFGNTGFRFGAHGEYVCLTEKHTLVKKPENISFEQAAAVPLGGLNALHFMRLAKIKPGDNVLINGAGGSIGAIALQIAIDMGAEVSVVDGGHKEAMLRALGSVEFFDYTKENFTDSGQLYDVVFDMVAQSTIKDCAKVLKSGGRYLTGNPRFMNILRGIYANRFTDKTVTFAFANETEEELLELKRLLEEGRISPPIDRVLPMEKAAEAHTLVETEQRIGAIVLAIAQ